MKVLSLAVVMLLYGTALSAQGVLVEYPAPANTTVAQNQNWTPILYVNGMAIAGAKPVCTGTPILCTFPLPNITPLLTQSGDQRFELALREPVIGREGPKTPPLVLPTPGAAASMRFK
jgi:hypothetical protein